MISRRALLAGASLVTAGVALSARPALAKPKLELLMFDQRNCPPCLAFRRQILPTYSSHRLGSQAKLRIINTRAKMPSGLSRYASIKNTPTFILLKNGREVRRAAGYFGENNFWGFVSAALSDAR